MMITVQEACRLAGVSEGLVRRYAAKGAFVCRKDRHDFWLIDQESFLRWREEAKERRQKRRKKKAARKRRTARAAR